MLELTRSNTGHKYIHCVEKTGEYQVKLTSDTTTTFFDLNKAVKFRNRALKQQYGDAWKAKLEYYCRDNEAGILKLYGTEMVRGNRVRDAWVVTGSKHKYFYCSRYGTPEAAFLDAVVYLCRETGQVVVMDKRKLFVRAQEIEIFLAKHNLPSPIYLCN